MLVLEHNSSMHFLNCWSHEVLLEPHVS